MKYEFLKAIDTVCKMSDISLKLSDIVECKSIEDDSYDIIESVFLHCKNDKEMFEFNMRVDVFADSFEITFTEVENSPHSCDKCMIILDREYNIIAN